jgi:hypothetical protein
MVDQLIISRHYLRRVGNLLLQRDNGYHRRTNAGPDRRSLKAALLRTTHTAVLVSRLSPHLC